VHEFVLFARLPMEQTQHVLRLKPATHKFITTDGKTRRVGAFKVTRKGFNELRVVKALMEYIYTGFSLCAVLCCAVL
jgi:hypothetical protein